MTWKKFKEYRDICGMIDDLEEKAHRTVSEKVIGSSSEYPFSKKPLDVSAKVGLTQDESKRLEELRQEKAEIEQYVEEKAKGSRSDERLLRAVMKYGTDWQVIRGEMGGMESADTIRVRYTRLF